MKISELAEKTGLKPINPYTDKEVDGVYISDMVSDIITGAKPNGILVTLQTHKSLIAAANLVDVAMIVIVKGKVPAEDVVALANKAGIALFVSTDDAWTYARKLTDLGLK
ncbi:MAG: hypothetical protein A2Y56_04435 [Candidatus Aminicenantes bacterium RBG_13_63_10]|nr:MAG: hypothetical protein A2Y56_04435 [Candidatus Aminicenantes bacterium RBG_13_63_10]